MMPCSMGYLSVRALRFASASSPTQQPIWPATGCRGRPIIEGITVCGLQSPANPACVQSEQKRIRGIMSGSLELSVGHRTLLKPEPLSMTMGALSDMSSAQRREAFSGWRAGTLSWRGALIVDADALATAERKHLQRLDDALLAPSGAWNKAGASCSLTCLGSVGRSIRAARAIVSCGSHWPQD